MDGLDRLPTDMDLQPGSSVARANAPAGLAHEASAPLHVAAVRTAPTKACNSCNRIDIGVPFQSVSKTRVFFGLFFIYAPIVFLPFFLLSGVLVYLHLRLMGAQNLKTLRDFLPKWSSHRYSYKTQITKNEGPAVAFWSRMRGFWIFNCTFYCPVSVATIEWNTYLVKAVENWWCPFFHDKKPDYATARLDYSFWHNSKDELQLHPDDRDNPIWNKEAKTQPHDRA